MSQKTTQESKMSWNVYESFYAPCEHNPVKWIVNVFF